MNLQQRYLNRKRKQDLARLERAQGLHQREDPDQYPRPNPETQARIDAAARYQPNNNRNPYPGEDLRQFPNRGGMGASGADPRYGGPTITVTRNPQQSQNPYEALPAFARQQPQALAAGQTIEEEANNLRVEGARDRAGQKAREEIERERQQTNLKTRRAQKTRRKS